MSDNPSLDLHPCVGQWLAFDTDGNVVVRTGKVEIGQGIGAALALIVAEELDLDLARVRLQPVTTANSPDEGYTSGSNSMQHSGTALRLAAATLRKHMLLVACSRLTAGIDDLELLDGHVRARTSNRTVQFAALVSADDMASLAIDATASTKASAMHDRIGMSVSTANPALDLEGLVTGERVFIQDLSPDGMVHARVVRPAHYHARLAEGALAALPDIDNVEIICDGSFVAVVSPDEYTAVRARERVFNALAWRNVAELDDTDLATQLLSNPRESLPVVAGVPQLEPVPAPIQPQATETMLTASYSRPYHMHASIGPSAALAHYADRHLRVWTHTQGIFPVRASIARALHMALSDVTLEHVQGAGCYGHNGSDDAAFEAALLARAKPGTPVMLKWSREDEHAWEPYGSCMAMQLSATIDKAGELCGWGHETYSDTHIARPRLAEGTSGEARLVATQWLEEPLAPPIVAPSLGSHNGLHRNAEPYYAFPNTRIVKHLVRKLPLRVSALRTLGAFANVFALESFVDEVCAHTQSDPVQFRRRYLNDPRAISVLDGAADTLGFRARARPDGCGHGIAFARYKNAKAYAAVGVELDVDDAAKINLRRVVIVADAGQVIDREGIQAQLEGGALQAASWLLYEQVTFSRNGITSRDWDSYPILRFGDVPQLETVVINRPDAPYLGVGEASCGPTAGAIANAVFDATGLRVRRMPFSPDELRRIAAE